ncbi:DUF1450 domain-containing protein [Effusibacillus lacus]|uniref:DUF1450 domain-containing protein n=1 Tax=Effusibacillus lacus TaxID=1348429 RepID=A0A292YJY8_9BACL|nr:DUF1450 domain-containing protein [Effusibacillus lacus]TCS72278.1 uncharacterized protein YuzB (UPF0349 family) [Effusibacillus lacus]GAX90248.1 hypothetical protein EFBL_1874 [Effusibacillus lacus]
MIVEICETNETRELIGEIRTAFPDAEIVVYSCLERCNACYLTLFVLIDGTLVEAYSPQQLLEKIKQFQ